MHNFVVKIDPATQEELYSDVSNDFVGFLVIEAIMNILVAAAPDAVSTLESAEFVNEYPENQLDTSAEYMLEVTKSLDQANGITIDNANYDYNSDNHELAVSRLNLAIHSIEAANDISTILGLSGIFSDPSIVSGFHFNAIHGKGCIVYCLYSHQETALEPNVTLASLLEPTPVSLNSLDLANLSFKYS